MIYDNAQLKELITRVSGGISSIRIPCTCAAAAARTRQALYRKSRLMEAKIRISFEPPHHLVLSPIRKLNHEPV